MGGYTCSSTRASSDCRRIRYVADTSGATNQGTWKDSAPPTADRYHSSTSLKRGKTPQHPALEIVASTQQETSDLETAGVCNKQCTRLDMNKVLFESFGGSEITDVILEDASKLFSENYGIWGKGSGRAGWQHTPPPLHN